VAKSDPRKLLGQRVRDLRVAKGLSQEKLAELAKLHRNYVGSIERGQKNVVRIRSSNTMVVGFVRAG
jgi:transcriptional regulator with XRE-family HTH domain